MNVRDQLKETRRRKTKYARRNDKYPIDGVRVTEVAVALDFGNVVGNLGGHEGCVLDNLCSMNLRLSPAWPV